MVLWNSSQLEINTFLVSTYVVCERLSVMHKQVSVHIPQTVNFCPNSPESPFLEFQTRKPLPQKWKTSALRWSKFTPEYPPNEKLRFEMTKVYSGIPPQMKTSDFRWPKFTPEYLPNQKLQIWDDQSLLQNTPPPHRLAILEIVCGD